MPRYLQNRMSPFHGKDAVEIPVYGHTFKSVTRPALAARECPELYADGRRIHGARLSPVIVKGIIGKFRPLQFNMTLEGCSGIVTQKSVARVS